MRSSWGLWVCLVWAWGCWGRISLLLKLPKEGKWRGRYYGLLGIQRRTHGKGSVLYQGRFALDIREDFSNIGTVFLEKWLIPHGCQGLKDIWTMPLTNYFNIWSAQNWWGSWTECSLQVPSNRKRQFYSLLCVVNDSFLIAYYTSASGFICFILCSATKCCYNTIFETKIQFQKTWW